MRVCEPATVAPEADSGTAGGVDLDDDARLKRALDPTQRIDWSVYTDSELEQLALLADRYGQVRVLRKIRRATLRRESARASRMAP